MKLHRILLEGMVKSKGRDGNLPTNPKCLKELKDKMKREAIQETDKRKDGRVQFLRVPLLRNPEERN